MMFYRRFNMTQNPFIEQPPLHWLLKDERMDQGLARLDYFAREGLAALLIGMTGVGKSSLLRLFMQRLEQNRCPILYLHLANLAAPGLLRLIVAQLGEEPKLGKDRLFRQILQGVQKSDAPAILILDEAHLIAPDALTDLRLLLSSALDDAPKLKLLLCGQHPLQQLLSRQAHADLAARIAVRYRIEPLTQTQTQAYIDARMRNAGAPEKCFEPEAAQAIHEYAQGNPRQINNIATAALINADAQDKNLITETLVNHAMNEFRLP
jgi:general secretion pathway protein A